MQPQTETVSSSIGAASPLVGWHVAPKSGIARDRLLNDLDGVPKAALGTVFGKAMGRRIWERVRRSNESARQPGAGSSREATSDPLAAELTDTDVILAMIESVGRRAAETLSLHKRQAKAIGLMLTYADGVVTSESVRLARPSADAGEICGAAVGLFRCCKAREAALVSVNLTTPTLQAEAVLDPAAPLHCAMAPSHA
jgi:hypothetical protein